MGKTIGLKQIAEKKYNLVQGLPEDVIASLGEIEESWDAIIYGASGNGKTNFAIILLRALIQSMNVKCEYISYEEGHAKTIQNTLIATHNMLEEVGNKLQITDHLTFNELITKMAKKQSAKIWVIDSLQAAGFTYNQCKQIKEQFVLGRKKKLIIYLSWSDGKLPQGAAAKAVEYYANIKMRVEGFIMFPKSRYGGNKPFVIWEGNDQEGAKKYWGRDFWKKSGKKKPYKIKKQKEETTIELITNLQILPLETVEEKAKSIWIDEPKTAIA